jgi:hypothetical protein
MEGQFECREVSITSREKLFRLPQGGFVLQPRVAASATLGTRNSIIANRKAIASLAPNTILEPDATA